MNTRESFRVRPYQEADLADCTNMLFVGAGMKDWSMRNKRLGKPMND